jgi:SAM-dependent methyltransferase
MIENHASKERMSDSVRLLWEKYYPEAGQARFEELLDRLIEPGVSVLEIGAGSGRNHQNHFAIRGRVARYVGVDPEPSVETNPYLDEGYRSKADSLPFADSSFDLIFHHFVAEHFESPFAANCEIARVLKPGGTLLFLTSSRFYYACLAARITPQWFHELYVRRFGSGRTSNEVFPTFYRLNDDRAIGSQLRKCASCARLNITPIRPAICALAGLVSWLGCFSKKLWKDGFLPFGRQLS